LGVSARFGFLRLGWRLLCGWGILGGILGFAIMNGDPMVVVGGQAIMNGCLEGWGSTISNGPPLLGVGSVVMNELGRRGVASLYGIMNA